eukprot:14083813-Alexandrium_andersonii.AAC.1
MRSGPRLVSDAERPVVCSSDATGVPGAAPSGSLRKAAALARAPSCCADATDSGEAVDAGSEARDKEG